ncbi:unnamed protein product, partial [Chrysoparadoxa australica]
KAPETGPGAEQGGQRPEVAAQWRQEVKNIAHARGLDKSVTANLLKCCEEVEAAARKAKRRGSPHSAIAAGLLNLKSGKYLVSPRTGPGVASAQAGLSLATHGAHAESWTHINAPSSWRGQSCAQVVSCCPCRTCAQAIIDLRVKGPVINLVIYGHSAAVQCEGADILQKGIKSAMSTVAAPGTTAATGTGASHTSASAQSIVYVHSVESLCPGMLKRLKWTTAGTSGTLDYVGKAVRPANIVLLGTYVVAHTDAVAVQAAQRRLHIAKRVSVKGKPAFMASWRDTVRVRQIGAHLVGEDELRRVIQADSNTPELLQMMKDLTESTKAKYGYGERPVWVTKCDDRLLAVKQPVRMPPKHHEQGEAPGPPQSDAVRLGRKEERNGRAGRRRERRGRSYRFQPYGDTNRFGVFADDLEEEEEDDEEAGSSSGVPQQMHQVIKDACYQSRCAAHVRKTKRRKEEKMPGTADRKRTFTVVAPANCKPETAAILAE